MNEDYGVSNDDPVPITEPERLIVHENRFSIQTDELTNLPDKVNPLYDSDNYLIDLYLLTIQKLRSFGYTT